MARLPPAHHRGSFRCDHIIFDARVRGQTHLSTRMAQARPSGRLGGVLLGPDRVIAAGPDQRPRGQVVDRRQESAASSRQLTRTLGLAGGVITVVSVGLLVLLL
jgi:hypothetical protein